MSLPPRLVVVEDRAGTGVITYGNRGNIHKGGSSISRFVFINLPAADLVRSIAFYEAMGAVRNPQYSDDTAACMVLSDIIHVMLLTHDKFRQFTPRPVADARAATEVLLCISADSRADVDAMVASAAASGGRADPGPAQDDGLMYSRRFEDPDGHIWEIIWMNPDAAKAVEPSARTC